eukprot:scaffold2962_cov126-Cylindrotheca_fusiformis.AAC.16
MPPGILHEPSCHEIPRRHNTTWKKVRCSHLNEHCHSSTLPDVLFLNWRGGNQRQELTRYYCEAQHSTAQHSTAQHSTAQHSTAQHSIKTFSMRYRTIDYPLRLASRFDFTCATKNSHA